MLFYQNLEHLHNCLFLDFEWSVVLEIDRTKENTRYMGSINIIPFWPIKCACTNFVKKLEFHKWLTCFEYSAKIVVLDIIYSIVVSRQESLGGMEWRALSWSSKIMAFLNSGMLLWVNILLPAKYLA